MKRTSGQPNLGPSSSLVLPNTATPPPEVKPPPPNRFLLFTEEWLEMQSYVAQSLQLPITVNDFKKTYGDFAQQSLITDTVGALKDLQAQTTAFGDPILLKQQLLQNPAYLQTTTPPEQLYGHIVWLASHISNIAGSFNNTYGSVQMLLDPNVVPSAADRHKHLVEMLTGKGGLASQAETMRLETNKLVQKLLRFDKAIAEANGKVQHYTSSESTLMAEANKAVGELKKDIKDTQDAADHAYKKWKDYTIAAVSTSVGITILSAGALWIVGLGLGIGLGVAASNAKDQYNKLMADVAKLEVQKQQKVQLVSDLTGFNTSINLVAPAMQIFYASLQEVEGVWNNIGMDLAFIVNNYGVDQLSDLAFINQFLGINNAQIKWREIATTAKDFTASSLTSFNRNTQWGQPIAA